MQFFASLTKTSALVVIYFNVCVFFTSLFQTFFGNEISACLHQFDLNTGMLYEFGNNLNYTL